MDSQEKSDQSAATDVPVSRRSMLLGGTALAASSALIAGSVASQRAQAQEQPAAPAGGNPNILVIWSDDQTPGPRALVSQHHDWVAYKVLDVVGAHLVTFKDYPPRQKGTSMSVDQMMESITSAAQHR